VARHEYEEAMQAERKQPDILSIHRSFVVHIYAGVDVERGKISGRVEHVVSGEAAEFASAAQLLHSIDRLLNRAAARSER